MLGKGPAQQSFRAAQATDQKQRAPLPNPPLACGKRRGRSAEPCSAGACPEIPPRRASLRSKARAPLPNPPLAYGKGRERSAEPCSARGLPSYPSAPRKPQIQTKSTLPQPFPLPAAKGGSVVPSHARQGPAQKSLRAAQPTDQKQKPLPSPPLACGKGRERSAEPCSATCSANGDNSVVHTGCALTLTQAVDKRAQPLCRKPLPALVNF